MSTTRSASEASILQPETIQKTFRLQSSSPPRLQLTGRRNSSKPDLGIFVPPHSSRLGTAQTSATASTNTSSPVRRKPLPGSANSQSQTRSRTSSESSVATTFPPRSSSLRSATFSPKSRSYTVSSLDIPTEVEVLIRDLDQYGPCTTSQAIMLVLTDEQGPAWSYTTSFIS